MPQPAITERRREARTSTAFALWLKPEGSARAISAWMLDCSAGGAGLLTPREESPPVGTRVRLAEMHTHDRLVRDEHLMLPACGRVLRHDPANGLTQRIAIQFETDTPEPLAFKAAREARASLPPVKSLPLAPPLPRPDGVKQAGQASRRSGE